MDELGVLKQAMKLEREGLEFYLRAAEHSDDRDTAQMFRDLASEEVDHYNYIGRQYDALAAGETWVPIPDLAHVEAVDLKAPVFPQGVQPRSTRGDWATSEDALLFALGAEVKSYELYSQKARQVEAEAARRLFVGLAAAEQQHFNIVMARYEARFGYPR